VWTPYRFAFLGFLLLCAGVSIANLFIDSDALADATFVLFGLVMIGVFGRDLRRERQVSPRYRVLLWAGLAAGVLVIVSVIGDRIS
jgi:uncharacterized membrane protein